MWRHGGGGSPLVCLASAFLFSGAALLLLLQSGDRFSSLVGRGYALKSLHRANRSDPGVWVARPPHTPLFTIGLHKTGTESYQRIYAALGLASQHGQYWSIDSGDAFADGGVSPFNWSERVRFGHGNSFDPTVLHECWFGASFVLSIRSLFSWLTSKLKHHLIDCTGTEADIARVSEKLRMWTDFRDRYHRRVLDFAMENASFAKRLAIIDLPGAHTRNASCDICRLLERGCCGRITREIIVAYPGLQARNWTTWTNCVEQGMERALRDLRIPEGEARLVLQRPLLSLPIVRSPAVLTWLRASGYARFAEP